MRISVTKGPNWTLIWKNLLRTYSLTERTITGFISASGRQTLTNLNANSSKPAEAALALRLGDRLHAIPIAAIEEVLPTLPIEPVPQCPAFVRGVIFVRGQVIPVLSAAERLGLEDYARPDEPNIICLRVGDRLVGVEFDEALDLIQMEDDESLAAEHLGADETFFTGVIDHGGQIVRVLDPEKLVSESEAQTLQKMPRMPRVDTDS